MTGIKVHSEVRYAGAPAGRVIAMRHLTAAERAKSANNKDAVIVTVELDDGIPPLPADVTATLSADTLLAPKFVALSAGTPGGKTLAEQRVDRRTSGLWHRTNHRRRRTAFRKCQTSCSTISNVTVTDLHGDLGEFHAQDSAVGRFS